MELAVGIVAAIVIVALAITMFALGKKDYQGLALHMAKRQRAAFAVLKLCPLCGEGLIKGQTLKTKVIEIASASSRSAPKGVKENRAEVYGCPHCWPATKDHPRICPACRQKLGESDIVFARYFERNEGKNHLHVLGCSRCRRA